MADELARWAAARAPDLIARAEAEVVAELRAALARAAVGRRDEPVPAVPVPEAAPAPRGEVLWAFGVVAGGCESAPSESALTDARPRVDRIVHGDLALLVSPVPRAEFGEEPLRRNLNDLAWLERVARAHEGVLEDALRRAPVVPLRLSTIFESEASALRMLERHADALLAALEALDGRQEWSVKLLVQPDRLVEAAVEDAPAEAGSTSAGAAYMLRRREERAQRDSAARLAASIADDVHARLADWAIDAVVRPPQNRELSGHEGDMLLNGAYLVEAAKVPQLRELVSELRERHAGLGARIELAGPFPPYNFVPRLDA